MDTKERTVAANSAINRNQTVNSLREISDAKLKDGDITALLTDNDWKVDQAAEKLFELTFSCQNQAPQISTVCTSSSNGQPKSLKLNLVSAKLPPHSRDPVELPILSPKTPHVVSNFLQYGDTTGPETIHPAMDALGRFGETTSGVSYLDPSEETFPGSPGSVMEPKTPHGVGLTPVAGGPTAGSLFVSTQQSHDGPGLSTIIEHQRTESLSPSSQGDGSISSLPYNGGPSLIQEQVVSPSAMSAAFPQRVMSLTMSNATSSDNSTGSQNKPQAHMTQKPRGSRKKTLSLNPEEREALENLIEDVIMGGVASDESSNSSESDDEGELRDCSLVGDGSKEGVLNKEGLPKIYPAQLKVAVKHMRNLPPRFMRRLENAQKKIDAAERIEAERAREEQTRLELEAREKEQERMKSREDQKREKKKEIRNLLDDLDQYTDEQSILQNKDAEQCLTEDKNTVASHKKVITEPTKEVEDFMESSQPVHIGLSKAQNSSQGVRSHSDFAQKQLRGQNSSMSGTLPMTKVLNCEDLERELLNRADYGVPTSVAMFCNNQQPDIGGIARSVNMHAYPFAGSQNAIDAVDRRTFLSADAPEFVPLNLLSYGQQPGGQNFQPAPIRMQAPNLQMPSSNSTIQNPSLLLSSPNLHDAKYRSLPKDTSPSACIEMLQSNASSQSPVGRMSPQVVNTSTSQSAPQLIPVSGTDVPVPPTSQSIGKLPTFMVPKASTSVALHQPAAPPAAVPQHQGIAGVIPINPYQIPYNYATAAFPPPQQGFAYQPFFPPASYIPWNEGNSDKLGPRGLIGHHPLIGVPLKASPQMTRKRGTQHPGPRPAAPPVRQGLMQVNKVPASDVKLMNPESAKKLLQQLLEEGKKVMVLLRGCPGSGKSTLAKEIVFDGTILSTDDYFLNNQGVYEYDKGTLSEAHLWNQNRAKQAVEAGTNPVIIDNTNLQSWEMKSYVSMAQKQGYHIEIIEPNTPWRQNVKELAKRNIHGVSVSSIRKMLDLYEHNVTLQSIFGVQTPTEKQLVVDTQQQNQTDGEQQGQKTPHKRRRKKRKRKRHRSKKDKTGSQQGAQKHSSGESSDDDDDDDNSIEKSTARLFGLLEKRPSLTSNETTTSPRETTPELMEKSDQWENMFSDIKEDSQPEPGTLNDVSESQQQQCDGDKVCCDVMKKDAFGGEAGHISAEHPVEERHVSNVCVLDAGIKNPDSGYIGCSIVSASHNSSVEHGASATEINEHDAANGFCDKHAVSGSCSDDDEKCDPNGESDDVQSAVAVIVGELLSLVESGICDTLLSQNCAQNNPGISASNADVETSDSSHENSVNDFTLLSEERNISTNNCDLPLLDETMSKHLNDAVPSDNNTPSESVATGGTASARDNVLRKKLKQEITDSLQERVLMALVEQELMMVLDNTGEYLEHHSPCGRDQPLLPDVMDVLDESDEMHLTTIADIKKALEDISYDNPVLDIDSDIDLDNEYGLEATGKMMKMHDIHSDTTVKFDSGDFMLPSVVGAKNKSVLKGNDVVREDCIFQEQCGLMNDGEATSKGIEFNNNGEYGHLGSDNSSRCDSSSNPSTIDDCKCGNDFSEVITAEVNKEEKTMEAQYWMTKKTVDAYCIPLANRDEVLHPVINYTKDGHTDGEQADSLGIGSLSSTDINLVKPKPKRERTGTKRNIRKAKSGETDSRVSKGGSSECDDWTLSDTLNDDFIVTKGVESKNVEEFSSQEQKSKGEPPPASSTHYQPEANLCSLLNDSRCSSHWETEKSVTIEVRKDKCDDIEKSCGHKIRSSPTVSSYSQTEPRDLVFIQKLRQSDLEAILIIDEFGMQGMLETSARDITMFSHVVNATTVNCSSHPWICKIHTSSQTEELPELEENQQLQDKVLSLQMCFPSLSREDVEHILEQCQGDMEWASNILLDGSTEFGSQPETKDLSEGHDVLPNGAKGFSPTEKEVNITSCKKNDVNCIISEPESLVTLCYKKSLTRGLVTPSSKVLSQLVIDNLDQSPGLDQSKAAVSSCEKFDLDSGPTDVRKEPSPICANELSTSPVSFSALLSPTNTASTNTASTSVQPDSALLKSSSRDTTVLRMPKEFAEQLLQIFGPLPNYDTTESLIDDCLDVNINIETAKEIYHCWSNTLAQKLSTTSLGDDNLHDIISEDEALARLLQEEEYKQARHGHVQTSTHYQADDLCLPISNKKGRSPCSSSSSQSSRGASPSKKYSREASPTKGAMSQLHKGGIITVNRSDRSQSPLKSALPTSSKSQTPVPNLREIMDEEMALEASIAEYLNCQNDVQTNKDTMSTRLNWQKLIERFPKVDELMLYDVFQSTGFHVDSTISAIERSLSQQGPPKTVMTQEAAEQIEEKMFQQAVEESLKMWPDTEETPTKEDLYQTLGEPLYSDFKEEAYEHYRKRQECLQKATIAYRRGMLQVASYYSQQGQLHYEKLKEANHKAAEMIVNYKAEHIGKTNSIDLHGLHVDEALKTLENILTTRELEQREKPDKRKCHLIVVTGRGTHSRGGIARIRPAIVDFLKRNNYRFTETSPSMIKVQLKYRDINTL